ncbi:restriction endonuclease subunit S [Luteipulveratus flavus]|uniref:Restriction endonuclease subunit S n=1 Tax=Luteipulveratus flavus TaxID=3031728 RepID=A0ABT6C8X6_9MICO|nr:restriction endonuclease subunit S [Luteipulveratus sp. YIM 133296]MDF8265176.1 restriction endonuclease subunit S [Luteipulveratus sp. YIM 133296]
MSRIDDLIAELCPAGVGRKRIGDIAVNSDRRRKPVTRSAREIGQYPYYGANGIQDYVKDYIFDGTFLLIGEDGSVKTANGKPVLNWATGKIWVNNHAHILQARSEDELDLRYLYFALQAVDISPYVTGGTQPKLNQANMNMIEVPVPPLEVQREIVRILDQFAQLEVELEAELDAELEARQVQFDYYRDTQLTFPESPRLLLGDVGSIFGGLTGKSKADFANGNARFVSYVNVFNNIAVNTRADDFVQVRAHEKQRTLQRGDIIFTGSSETAAEVGMSSVVTAEVSEPLYLNSFCIGFRPTDDDLIDPDFAKHLFRSDEMRRQIVRTASGVTRFNVSKARLAQVEIPIPPKDEQRRLAGLLDSFKALVNDISTGLAAERGARHKQYEYYRDKLLTFSEIG